MVRVSGTGLSSDDKLFIRYVAKYTLNYLLPNGEHERNSVCIKVGSASGKEEDDNAKGTCLYRGKRKKDGRMRCDVWLLKDQIDYRYKNNMWPRFEAMVPALVHELMHVKQYFSGELVDVGINKYRFRGKLFKNAADNDLDGYFNQEYEVQAYGHERHLTERFRRHWIDLLAKKLDD